LNEAGIEVLIAAEPELRVGLAALLRREGLCVQEAEDHAAAMEQIQRRAPDVVLLDAGMPDGSAREVLRLARELDSGLGLIMVAAAPDLREVVEAMKAGASDYLPYPSNSDGLVAAIRRACSERRRHAQLRQEEAAETKSSLLEQMGGSEKVRRLAAEVARVAPTNFSVVIVGETGSGKEVVAQAIHAQSHRASGPFLALDCGAIPDPLIENELFGHERGSFTGADQTKRGKFDAASGGTLLLDEIANLPIAMQGKLLRALQEKQVYRIGGMMGIKVDVRVIVATNQDLQALVAAKTFRGDLFHRLSEYMLYVLALRERREDIPFLAQKFLGRTNLELGKRVRGFSEAALQLLLAYDWPGNVRELRNVVRGAVLLADEVIGPKQLRLRRPLPSTMPPADPGPENEDSLSLKDIVQRSTIQVERSVVLRALARARGNKAKAARILGIDYKTIHSKIRLYGI
jgi:two-component system nitrogen regulation response regulator GlnG